METWALIIDVAKCESCNLCFLSCKDEYLGNDFKGYSLAQPRFGQRWIDIRCNERGEGSLMEVNYLPTPCMHCERGACVSKAKNGAVYRRKDGIVLIDPEKARGQRGIVDACPYGAVYWNEEQQVPQKCTLCAHLLDEGWEEPRCVQSCPTGALRIVKAGQEKWPEIVEQQNLQVLRPDYKTRPRVFYKNLHLWEKCFLSGSVAIRTNGNADCAEGARVLLMRDGKKVNEALTDNYGDFKFDHLKADNQSYIIEISYRGNIKKILNVDMKGKSLHLGDIYLHC